MTDITKKRVWREAYEAKAHKVQLARSSRSTLQFLINVMDPYNLLERIIIVEWEKWNWMTSGIKPLPDETKLVDGYMCVNSNEITIFHNVRISGIFKLVFPSMQMILASILVNFPPTKDHLSENVLLATCGISLLFNHCHQYCTIYFTKKSTISRLSRFSKAKY